jgi:hypothetical protein
VSDDTQEGSDAQEGQPAEGDQQSEIEGGIYTVATNVEIAEIPADAYDPVPEDEGELS